jgi:hypothetical protein
VGGDQKSIDPKPMMTTRGTTPHRRARAPSSRAIFCAIASMLTFGWKHTPAFFAFASLACPPRYSTFLCVHLCCRGGHPARDLAWSTQKRVGAAAPELAPSTSAECLQHRSGT